MQVVSGIKRKPRGIDLPYELDIFLHVGAEISSTCDPSGLHVPRVSVAKRRMTGQIRINRDEVREAPDLKSFLQSTIHRAVKQMIEHIAARDATVDADVEIREVAFLGEQ